MRIWTTGAAMALALLLAACGDDGTYVPPKASTFTVGGTVTGNTGSIVLQDNGGDNLTTSGPGVTFATALANGASYSVTVLTAPAGQTCTVTNGTGTVSSANITNVAVNCTTPAVTTATTGSSAFSVFSTSTTRIAFVPITTGTTGVFPVALPSISAGGTGVGTSRVLAAATTPSLALIPMTFNGTYGPDACSIDSAADKAVCISLQSSTVEILDLSTFATTLNSADIVATAVTLSDLPATVSSFSGDSCLNCGVVAIPHASNPAQGQFVVAGYDGYYVYNYPASTATTATAASVYHVPISENLSVDPTRNWIIAPGYSPGGTNGRQLNVIDLAKGSVFAWSQATDSCTSETVTAQQTLCGTFKLEEIDSSSIDVTTGILTLQSESGDELLQIDMGQAVFSGSSFTAPHQFASTANTTFIDMSGVLSSGSGDYLFIASEFSADAWIAGASLPAASGTGGNFPASYTFNAIYVDLTATLTGAGSAQACTTFTGGYDPHRQATTLSTSGKQYGIYASADGSCLALVDMAGLLAAPHTTDPNHVDSGYNLVSHGVVQYVAVP